MKLHFIELTGKTLLDVVNEGEVDLKQLHQAGVCGDSILRINKHGEIELRCRSDWTLVGGLIGNFEERLVKLTGLDWSTCSCELLRSAGRPLDAVDQRLG